MSDGPEPLDHHELERVTAIDKLVKTCVTCVTQHFTGGASVAVEGPARKDEVLVLSGNAVYTQSVEAFDRSERAKYKKVRDVTMFLLMD